MARYGTITDHGKVRGLESMEATFTMLFIMAWIGWDGWNRGNVVKIVESFC